MMDRRRFLLTSLAGALAAPRAVGAQHPGQSGPRVAVVIATSPTETMAGPDPAHPQVRAFVRALRDLGYVEGRNLVLERRSLEGRWERAPELFADLMRLKVQVIVVSISPLARAALRAGVSLPIVAIGGELVETGLVASLARPGGTVTGLEVYPTPEFSQKWLEFLKQAVPGLSRVGVLTGSQDPLELHTTAPDPEVIARFVRNLEAAARTLQLTLTWTQVKSAAQVAEALDGVPRQRPQALVTTQSSTLWTARRQIVAFALRHRLPMMSGNREFVEEGGLMSYSPDITGEAWPKAAVYVDKILKGAKPADLPIQQPTKYELVVNLKTAKTLGLTIPPSLLARADQVID
jgi:putative ABC transport system substrate-binding protein